MESVRFIADDPLSSKKIFLSHIQDSNGEKKSQKDRQVGRESFTAAPPNVSLLPFQPYSKNHIRYHPILPIRHMNDPLGKGLETHLPVLLREISEESSHRISKSAKHYPRGLMT
jgi:hypothetical protein